MKLSTIASLAIILPLVACSSSSDTWSSLSATPRGVTGVVLAADGSFTMAPPTPAQNKERASQLTTAAQAWLQDVNSVETRDNFAVACASVLDANAGGVSYRFIPLSKLGPDVDAAAARALRELLPRTPEAPSLSAVTEGPYLLMMRPTGGRIDNLLGDCLNLLGKLAPEQASLVTALRPLAETRDKDVAARFATLQTAAGAKAPLPAPAIPVGVMWFGRDSQPFAVTAGPRKMLRPSDVDPLEICGYDPDTTRERSAAACDRLLVAAARRGPAESGEIPKGVVKAWLLTNLENPVANFGEAGMPPLRIDRTQTSGASQ